MVKFRTVEEIVAEYGGDLIESYKRLIEIVKKDDSLLSYITAWNISDDVAMQRHFLNGLEDYLKENPNLHNYRTAMRFGMDINNKELLGNLRRQHEEHYGALGRINYGLAVLIRFFDGMSFNTKS